MATRPASGIPCWLSRDPIGERGGPNLYAFNYNNSINNGDSDGWAVVAVDSELLAPKGPTFRREALNLDGPILPAPPPLEPLIRFRYERLGDGCIIGPAKVKTCERADMSSNDFILMKLDLEIGGCYRDVKIRWWTCRRRFGREAGYIRECNDKKECSIGNVYKFFFWDSGPYFTRTTVRYLSCENGIWTRKEKELGVGYVHEDGKWVGQPTRLQNPLLEGFDKFGSPGPRPQNSQLEGFDKFGSPGPKRN